MGNKKEIEKAKKLLKNAMENLDWDEDMTSEQIARFSLENAITDGA